MADEPEDPTKVASFEKHRKQQVYDKFMEDMKPAHAIAHKMWEDRQKRIKWLAEAFDLDDRYNKKVLGSLLYASEEFEEPPFKLATDVGWLRRAYCLAEGFASYHRPNYPPWLNDARSVLAKASAEMDVLPERYRDCDATRDLFAVPDDTHTELMEIVHGLSLFSDRREAGKSHRYLCLVIAIVEACELPKGATE